ncbi:hypothetical protein ZWY2020_021327 [Hordeum vulgare]|nr:hypothetical protein ZWY2020_021327 [Hordeum vulgare]
MAVGKALEAQLSMPVHSLRVTAHHLEHFFVTFTRPAHQVNVVRRGSIRVDGACLNIIPWHEHDLATFDSLLLHVRVVIEKVPMHFCIEPLMTRSIHCATRSRLQRPFRRSATVRGWDHLQIGLRGEDLHLYNPSEASPEWVSDNSYPTNNPLTWYKSKFTAPAGDDPLAIDFTGMGKGEAWVNGQSIGRYWPTNIAPQSGFVNSCNYRGSYSATKCLKKCGQPSQILYHVPRSFLEPGSNDIVLFEQFGGNPSKISFMTKQIESVCAHVSEDHPDQIDSWVSSHQKLQRSGPALRMECPKEGQVISNIKFASFRTPGGTCGSYSHGECSSSQALAVSLRRHASGRGRNQIPPLCRQTAPPSACSPAHRLPSANPRSPPTAPSFPIAPPYAVHLQVGESLVPAPLVAIGTVAEQTVPQHHRAAEATAGRRDSSPSTGNMNIQTRGWNKRRN